MKHTTAISLKRLALANMQAVTSGRLSREEARGVVTKRYYFTTREKLIEELTRQYDHDCVVALDFFGMI